MPSLSLPEPLNRFGVSLRKSFLVVGLFLPILLSPTYVAAQALESDEVGYDIPEGCSRGMFDNHDYLFCRTAADRVAADQTCAGIGTTPETTFGLVKINTYAERSYLSVQMDIEAITGPVWVGLNQRWDSPTPADGWYWVKGPTLLSGASQLWLSGHPNDVDGVENNAANYAVFGTSDGRPQLQSVGPRGQDYPFVCEALFNDPDPASDIPNVGDPTPTPDPSASPSPSVSPSTSPSPTPDPCEDVFLPEGVLSRITRFFGNILGIKPLVTLTVSPAPTTDPSASPSPSSLPDPNEPKPDCPPKPTPSPKPTVDPCKVDAIGNEEKVGRGVAFWRKFTSIFVAPGASDRSKEECDKDKPDPNNPDPNKPGDPGNSGGPPVTGVIGPDPNQPQAPGGGASQPGGPGPSRQPPVPKNPPSAKLPPPKPTTKPPAYIPPPRPIPSYECQTATYNGHGYHFCEKRVTYDRARELCRAVENRDLMAINTPGERDWVTTTKRELGISGALWLGLYQLLNQAAPDQGWYWVSDGERINAPQLFGTIEWAAGFPKDRVGDGVERNSWNYGVLVTSGDKVIDTGRYEEFGFACESIGPEATTEPPEPPPPPSTVSGAVPTECTSLGVAGAYTQEASSTAQPSDDVVICPPSPHTQTWIVPARSSCYAGGYLYIANNYEGSPIINKIKERWPSLVAQSTGRLDPGYGVCAARTKVTVSTLSNGCIASKLQLSSSPTAGNTYICPLGVTQGVYDGLSQLEKYNAVTLACTSRGYRYTSTAGRPGENVEYAFLFTHLFARSPASVFPTTPYNVCSD